MLFFGIDVHCQQPPSTERVEDVEKTRTHYGTARQIGSGFYPVSSYLSPTPQPTSTSRSAYTGISTGDLGLILVLNSTHPIFIWSFKILSTICPRYSHSSYATISYSRSL